MPRPTLEFGVHEAPRELDKQKKAFDGRIHRLMAERGLTQAALAKRLKIEQPTLAELISGRHKPQPRTLKKLASALRCHIGHPWQDRR